MNAVKILAAGAAGLGFALGAGEASAEYVCNTFLVPGPTSAGNDGYVLANVYNGPSCTGGFIAARNFCTAGATFTSCPSNSAYRYDGTKLVAVFAALQRAAIHDEVVTISTGTCIGGGSGCATTASFSSN